MTFLNYLITSPHIITPEEALVEGDRYHRLIVAFRALVEKNKNKALVDAVGYQQHATIAEEIGYPEDMERLLSCLTEDFDNYPALEDFTFEMKQLYHDLCHHRTEVSIETVPPGMEDLAITIGIMTHLMQIERIFLYRTAERDPLRPFTQRCHDYLDAAKSETFALDKVWRDRENARNQSMKGQTWIG